MPRISPAWFLFLFAPVTAEYLSGSSSVSNPILVLVNLVLYGCGAILIRELKLKWCKGWLAVFLMGAAYAIVEEGLMLNTLFNPAENTAGRWLGVNWVWTSGMLVVHSWLSIFMPILMAEALYDDKVAVPWLKPRAFYGLAVLLALNVFGMGLLLVHRNRPGPLYWTLEFVMIAALTFAARWLPGPLPNDLEASSFHSSRWFYFASLVGTIVIFVVGFAAPSLGIPAPLKIAAIVAAYLGVLIILNRNLVFKPSLPPPSKLAVAAGVITFWMLVTPITAFGKHRFGPLMFGIFMAGFLWYERRAVAIRSIRGLQS